MESGTHILAGFQGSLSTTILSTVFNVNYLLDKPKLHIILMAQEEVLIHLKQCLDIYTNQHGFREAQVCLQCKNYFHNFYQSINNILKDCYFVIADYADL